MTGRLRFRLLACLHVREVPWLCCFFFVFVVVAVVVVVVTVAVAVVVAVVDAVEVPWLFFS